MSAFWIGIGWGVAHSTMLAPRDALDIGRFMVAGCIDAPDDIPAGGWTAEWFPEVEEWVPHEITIPREQFLASESQKEG